MLKQSLLLFEKQYYPFRNYSRTTSKTAIFVGCSMASFYPKTLKVLHKIMKLHNIGLIYDCCGAPLRLAGKDKTYERYIAKLVKRLKKHEIEKLVFLCPNCENTFKKSSIFTSVLGSNFHTQNIYELLARLNEENEVFSISAENICLFPPCPDRKHFEWLHSIKGLCEAELKIMEKAPCCGLGIPAALSQSDHIKACSTKIISEAKDGRLSVYCASCAGQLHRTLLEMNACTHSEPDEKSDAYRFHTNSCTQNENKMYCQDRANPHEGANEIMLVLSELLGVHETADVEHSVINRFKSKFW